LPGHHHWRTSATLVNCSGPWPTRTQPSSSRPG
jgi:hypothetical protein